MNRRGLRTRGGVGAGALAGLAAGVLLLVLRLLGVPMVTELLADRFLPLLPVDAFLQLLGRLGGPIQAKELAFAGGVAGPVVLGAAAGAMVAGARRPGRVLAAAAALLAAGLVALTWPVLDASYAGLPPAPARAANVAAIAAAVALAAGLLAALLSRRRRPRKRRADAGRRAVLLAGAGGVMAVATGGLATWLFRSGAFGYDGTRLLAVPRQPVTPVGDFYVVTKNLVDPDVDPALWRLEVAGAVEQPLSLTLDELRALDPATQEITLECISNGVGYGLLSNATWSGVTLARLLGAARPLASASALTLQGAVGYLHGLDLPRALHGGAMVAVEMNGSPLVARHGAPARAVVPGAYGEVSVKWLTRVTVLDHAEKGYYESQGWQAGTVHTTSVIDEPRRGQRLAAGQPAVVRGVAYAGDRGVSRVDVSTDGGATWTLARIDYARSPFAWALWSAPWTPAAAGRHTVVVRAYDGTGEVQESAAHGFAPSGATGLHSVEVIVA